MKKAYLFLSAVVGLIAIAVVVGQERPIDQLTPPNANQVHNHYYATPGGYGYGYGYGGGYNPGINAGAYATGVGNMRLSTSQAAENWAQTAHMAQENHNFAVNSYYANKDLHDAYVDAHRQKQLSPEEAARLHQMNEPGRLSSYQFDRSTNVINWPALLRDPVFTAERQTIDHAFHDRTAATSGPDSDSYVTIHQACDAMKATLGDKLRKDMLPAVTFCAAEHFIESLDYEATFGVK